jgi:hypothetical protein
MDIGRLSWRASAAYLYILRLDNISLAWEYLRRNSYYQADWLATATRWDSSTAGRWGLRYMEDPRRDARLVEPLWRPFPPSSVHLTRQTDAQPSARFQFWCIPGQKSLVHDGLGLHLTARHPPAVTRAVLDPDVGTDEPYAFLIPAGEHIQSRCRAVNEFSVSYHSGQSGKPKDTPNRPARSALTHMRTLQAFDGVRSGASQREIAGAIFGSDVVNVEWSPDSELRAQIRYFLRRGNTLAESGYRTLLNLDSS